MTLMLEILKCLSAAKRLVLSAFVVDNNPLLIFSLFEIVLVIYRLSSVRHI